VKQLAAAAMLLVLPGAAAQIGVIAGGGALGWWFYHHQIAAGASPKGTLDCVPTWGTDFRKDLARSDVPTLVIHGDSDRILPIAATGNRTHKAVKGARLVVVKGGPHGLIWTHADKVNPELIDFLK